MYPLPLFAYSASSAFYGFLFDYYITCTRSYTVLQSENRLCPIPPQLPSLRSKHFNSFDIQIYTSIYIRQTPRPVAIPPGSPRSDTNHNKSRQLILDNHKLGPAKVHAHQCIEFCDS